MCATQKPVENGAAPSHTNADEPTKPYGNGDRNGRKRSSNRRRNEARRRNEQPTHRHDHQDAVEHPTPPVLIDANAEIATHQK